MIGADISGKILVLDIYIESLDFIYNFTGKLSKTILLSEAPSLEHIFKPVKGFFKLLRVSPPIRGGKAEIPTYVVKKVDNKNVFELKPVILKGDYVIEVGSTSDVIDKLYNTFRNSMNLTTRVRFGHLMVKYVVNDVKIYEPKISVGGTITIKTLSPALLTNPYVPSQHVRRFTTTPSVVLWIPHCIANNIYTHNVHEALKTLATLEYCLAEHYTTKQKTTFINYDNKREPTLEIKTKYIITNNECKKQIEKTINVARIFGIGASRASGFGTIDIKTSKPQVAQSF